MLDIKTNPLATSAIVATAILVIVISQPAAQAAVEIANNPTWDAITIGTSPQVGQSFTVGSGPGYNEISVSFFTEPDPRDIFGTGAHASGELFLLSQSYAGASANLSSSTPGYIAQSTSAVFGSWLFDPSVTLVGNTTYWLYTKNMSATSLRFAASSNPYPGGIEYVETTPLGGGSTEFTARPNGDLTFVVQGNAVVPEPASAAMLAIGGLMLMRRRGVRSSPQTNGDG